MRHVLSYHARMDWVQQSSEPILAPGLPDLELQGATWTRRGGLCHFLLLRVVCSLQPTRRRGGPGQARRPLLGDRRSIQTPSALLPALGAWDSRARPTSTLLWRRRGEGQGPGSTSIAHLLQMPPSPRAARRGALRSPQPPRTGGLHEAGSKARSN
ncbi:unnamed protein product [Prorocentrum cordatum]|uniref:Uncharacterized protein n=1 Tax=Prorocentrum cordatum TaxID=2364126 RepID=A0ABN9VUK6_9DINO|nr:unnamed protein product [Polarella glacialis]